MSARRQLTALLPSPTGARCWDSPDAGIDLGVKDPQSGIESIRRSLDVTDPTGIHYVPHITLVHPRTTTRERARQAWAELTNWTIDERVVIDRVAMIELETDRWRVVQSVQLETAT